MCRLGALLTAALLGGSAATGWSGHTFTRTHAHAFSVATDNIAGRDYASALTIAPVDVVITWVNGSDPVWYADMIAWRRRAFGHTHTHTHTDAEAARACLPSLSNASSPLLTLNVTVNASVNATCASSVPDATDGMNRYRDNDELRYLMRSLERYAGWVRQIFLVTNGQVPVWLDTSNPRVRVVTHADIFVNRSHLPVFSSPAIEVHLHRIPGLSDKFIYFNDDVMLGSDVLPDDFFTTAQGQKVYLSWEVPKCAPGCLDSWLGDGYCDQACNTTRCMWDAGDCNNGTIKTRGTTYTHHKGGRYDSSAATSATSTTPAASTSDPQEAFCVPSCPISWLADKICDARCNVPECAWDAGDCGIHLAAASNASLRTSWRAQHAHIPLLDGEDWVNESLALVRPHNSTLDVVQAGAGSASNATCAACNASNASIATPTLQHVWWSETAGEVGTALEWLHVNLTQLLGDLALQIDRPQRVVVPCALNSTANATTVSTNATSPQPNCTVWLPPHVMVTTGEVAHDSLRTGIYLDYARSLLLYFRLPPPHKPLQEAEQVEASSNCGNCSATIASQDTIKATDNDACPGVASPAIVRLRGYSSRNMSVTFDLRLILHLCLHRMPAPPVLHESAGNDSAAIANATLNTTSAANAAEVVPSHTQANTSDDLIVAQQPLTVLSLQIRSANDTSTAGNAPEQLVNATSEAVDTADVEAAAAHNRLLRRMFRNKRRSRELSSAGSTPMAPVLRTAYRDADAALRNPSKSLVELAVAAAWRELRTAAFHSAWLDTASLPAGSLRGRRLEDTYGDSLIFTNRLITTAFTKKTRKVPAHMPHMVDRHAMEKLQRRFPAEFDATSSHRFRSSTDVQYAFAYFYFLMEGGARNDINVDEYFARELDTDGDGVLSVNEFRTLAAVVFHKSPTHEELTRLRQCIAPDNVTIEEATEPHAHDGHVAVSIRRVHRPAVTLDRLMLCDIAREGLSKYVRAEPTHQEMTLDEVAFEMVTDDFNKTLAQLDSVRSRKSKFICVNDDMKEAPREVQQLLHDFYQAYFPRPSAFEKRLDGPSHVSAHRPSPPTPSAAWPSWPFPPRVLAAAAAATALAAVVLLTCTSRNQVDTEQQSGTEPAARRLREVVDARRRGQK